MSSSSRSRLPAGAAAVALVVLSAVAVQLAMAPLRRLSGDEAYYLCASRGGWPIGDHPPLLGAWLALADRLLAALPVVLRVRAVAAGLQLVTTLGVVACVDAAVERDERDARDERDERDDDRTRGRARWMAAAFAGYGLLPMAGGLVTTPDAPLLAATAWLFAVHLRRPSRATIVLSFGFAALACLAKVTGLVVVSAVAFDALRRQRIAHGLASLAGALAVTPLLAPSLQLQIAHALGRGPLVSAPTIGPLASLAAFVLGQIALFSPAVVAVVLTRAGRAAWRRLAPGRLVACLLLVACIVSALISGRPPEPSWTAPMGVALFGAAALALALHPRRAPVVLVVATAPTLVALALWSMPASTTHRLEPLRKVPHAGEDPSDEPAYAGAARRCIEDEDCGEIRYIFARYRFTLTVNSHS